MKRALLAGFALLGTCLAQTAVKPVSARKSTAPVANLSQEFSRAALKALLATRDFADPSLAADSSENAEIEAKTQTEQEALQGLQSYSSWRTLYMKKGDTSLEAASIAEATSPGKCFVGLKTQYGSRIWTGVPKECKE